MLTLIVTYQVYIDGMRTSLPESIDNCNSIIAVLQCRTYIDDSVYVARVWFKQNAKNVVHHYRLSCKPDENLCTISSSQQKLERQIHVAGNTPRKASGPQATVGTQLARNLLHMIVRRSCSQIEQDCLSEISSSNWQTEQLSL